MQSKWSSIEDIGYNTKDMVTQIKLRTNAFAVIDQLRSNWIAKLQVWRIDQLRSNWIAKLQVWRIGVCA